MLSLAPLHVSPEAPAAFCCRQHWAVLPWPGEDQDVSLGAAQTPAKDSLGCQGLAAIPILPESLDWCGASLAQCDTRHELRP